MKKTRTRTSGSGTTTREEILEIIERLSLKNATLAPPDSPSYKTGIVIGGKRLFDIVGPSTDSKNED